MIAGGLAGVALHRRGELIDKLIACASVWLLAASLGTDKLRSLGLHLTSRGGDWSQGATRVRTDVP